MHSTFGNKILNIEDFKVMKQCLMKYLWRRNRFVAIKETHELISSDFFFYITYFLSPSKAKRKSFNRNLTFVYLHSLFFRAIYTPSYIFRFNFLRVQSWKNLPPVPNWILLRYVHFAPTLLRRITDRVCCM